MEVIGNAVVFIMNIATILGFWYVFNKDKKESTIQWAQWQTQIDETIKELERDIENYRIAMDRQTESYELVKNQLSALQVTIQTMTDLKQTLADVSRALGVITTTVAVHSERIDNLARSMR